ncbi:hypothetical protein ACVIIW_006897 [Bradyrhizobium sp. USDA 4449]
MAELLKISAPLLDIVAVPAVDEVLNVTKPVAVLVMLDPFAELVSLK